MGNFAEDKAFHFPAQVRDSLKSGVENPDGFVKTLIFLFSVIPAVP
jgi:hypothetical protein